MSWPCFMVEKAKGATSADGKTTPAMFKRDGVLIPWKDLPPGAMFYDFDGELTVKLPGYHCAFRPFSERDGGNPWTVTGDAPNLTIHPSINAVGEYHGYIVNGVLSDDVDGRKFDEAGKLIK
jgi:hypothetical protein